MNKRAGKTDKGIAILRVQNSKMICSSREEREVLVEDYCKLGTPNPNKRFDTECMKEINTCCVDPMNCRDISPVK